MNESTISTRIKTFSRKYSTGIVAILGLLVSLSAAVISGYFELQQAQIPIAATQTAEAKLITTAIALALITPSATHKPSPTLTPTNTPTTVPTYTPTPTNTSTSTNTPTNTPTRQITPTIISSFPEAVVITENGLNLRSGPGIDYLPIRFLRKGEALNIEGRIENDIWLKVGLADSGATGWILANSDFVEINVDLDTIPIANTPPPPTPTSTPMPQVDNYTFEFGPKLFEPRAFSSYGVGETVRFSWDEYTLQDDQFYSVIVVRDDLLPEDACIHIQTREPEATLSLDCPPGAYEWSVSITTKLPPGSEFEFRDDSEFDESNPLGIGIPHPDRPGDNAPPSASPTPDGGRDG